MSKSANPRYQIESKKKDAPMENENNEKRPRGRPRVIKFAEPKPSFFVRMQPTLWKYVKEKGGARFLRKLAEDRFKLEG